MADEGLEVVRYSLLCLVVPHLEQVVLATSDHVASVLRKISACDGTLMNCLNLADVLTLESCNSVYPHTLVLGYDDDLTVVLRELEASNDTADIDLVLQDDAIGAVDHDVVAMLAHNSKQALCNEELFLLGHAQVSTILHTTLI